MISVCGRDIQIKGRLLRIARLDADKYQFMDYPEPMLNSLKQCGVTIDPLTSTHSLP